MEAKKCERCGAVPRGMQLLDYCGVCSRDLCPNCMMEGCCGNVPAISGEELDNEDLEAAAEQSVQSDAATTCPTCGAPTDENFNALPRK